MPQLIENGRVIRPDIGIAQVYQTENGLLIATLSPSGPAERAGLRGFRLVRQQRRSGGFIYEQTRIDRSYADLITAVDGQKVRTTDDLMTLIESRKPGQQVSVTVTRDGKQESIPVTLGADD